jgi:glucose/arabinose dehydrogenase
MARSFQSAGLRNDNDGRSKRGAHDERDHDSRRSGNDRDDDDDANRGDRLAGTPRDDRLIGSGDDDRASAGEGADFVDGRGGEDRLSGGGGSDIIHGGHGDDVLYGFGIEDKNPRSGEITAALLADRLPPAVFLESPPGNPNLLFVATLPGLVFVFDVSGPQPVRLPAPALVIPPAPGQQLSGFTFHPDYAQNGRIFFNHSLANGSQVIVEYQALDADTINSASREVLLTIPYQPGQMTRGGWLGFGPDGLLYITTGDGGGEGPIDHSQGGVQQDPFSLRGKVLRIDVDSSPEPGLAYAIPNDNPFADGGGAPEVWALGLRQPHKASFDAAGNFYLTDVGHELREELNFIPAGTTGALNFGWPHFEGTQPSFVNIPLGPGQLVSPILEYQPGFGPLQGRAIVGGYVYDGPGGGQGLYFFSDFVAPRLFSTRIVDGEAIEFTSRYEQLVVQGGDLAGGDVVSMSIDGRGRLYTLELDGEIHLLTPSAAAGDGADQLHGGAGDDKLYGGAGADQLFGDKGDDRLWGGIGADRLDGGQGDDVLRGGFGADSLTGGRGDDIFAFSRDDIGTGLDIVFDFEGAGRRGGDRLLFEGFSDAATLAFVGSDGAGRHTYRVTDGALRADLVLTYEGNEVLGPGDYMFG